MTADQTLSSIEPITKERGSSVDLAWISFNEVRIVPETLSIDEVNAMLFQVSLTFLVIKFERVHEYINYTLIAH
ncbi:MAG: hypothetical protein PHD43_19530 [Methylococcales bacterium]|nr:hypothetical protein [Methylococcales bacterium]